MHPTNFVSAISTFAWELDADLAFYAAPGSPTSESRWRSSSASVGRGHPTVVDAGLRVTNLIGLGPFHLAEPARWRARRNGSCEPSTL